MWLLEQRATRKHIALLMLIRKQRSVFLNDRSGTAGKGEGVSACLTTNDWVACLL